jgi:hypothetical protein
MPHPREIQQDRERTTRRSVILFMLSEIFRGSTRYVYKY